MILSKGTEVKEYNIIAKSSIIDVWQGPKYVSVQHCVFNSDWFTTFRLPTGFQETLAANQIKQIIGNYVFVQYVPLTF